MEDSKPVVDKCRYCGVALKTARGREKHLCDKRAQALVMGEENLGRAHRLFNFWMHRNGFSRKITSKTVPEFIRSPYFGVFCEMYSNCVRHHIGDKQDFLAWVSDNTIPANRWGTDEIIEQYLQYAQRNGDASQQVIKSVQRIIAWAEAHGTDYRTFFKDVSVQEALVMIDRGDISPWVFCLANSIGDLIDRITDPADVDELSNVLDLSYWMGRVEVSAGETKGVSEILAQMEL